MATHCRQRSSPPNPVAHAASIHSSRLCTRENRPTGSRSPIPSLHLHRRNRRAGPDGCRVSGAPRGNLFLANCSPLDADTSIDSRFMPPRDRGRGSRVDPPCFLPPHVWSSTAGTVLYPVVGGQPDDVDIASAVTNGRAAPKKGGEATNTAGRFLCQQVTRLEILRYAALPP